MAKAKHGLGSGLGSLIPQEVNSAFLSETTEKIHHLRLDQIEPNKDQPRKEFDEAELRQLADSIKTHGVLQPIVVSPQGSKYLLVAGERRLRASKLAGKDVVPALVRTLKELERLEIALVENVQRVDLSPIEQAIGIEKLRQQFSMTYETIAKKLGKGMSTVNNISRLLQLPPEAIEALNKKFITEGHARAVLSLKGHPTQQSYLLKACINGWSVRQAERYVIGVKSGFKTTNQAKTRVATETPQTKALGKKLAAEVHIRRMAKGGRLEIIFSSDKDLERIIGRIANH